VLDFGTYNYSFIYYPTWLPSPLESVKIKTVMHLTKTKKMMLRLNINANKENKSTFLQDWDWDLCLEVIAYAA
jgi:hypothetical protein